MFHSPWYLLLLLLLPWVAWRLFATRRRPAVRFSGIDIAGQLRRTLRQRLLWLPPVLTIAAIALIIIALARPRLGQERTIAENEGIAIQLIVDRSGSMRAMDFQIDGESVDRLAAVKNVAGAFVTGEQEDASEEALQGRFSDLVGLITFAGFADGQTPPTLDHGFVVSRLNATTIAPRGNEDGTAIGDAIALAVEKLTALDERQSEKIKSKVIILLTDGENNAGDIEPQQAAELAKTLGIKIYTIGVGTKGRAPIPVVDLFGRERLRWMEVNIDEETLQRVAETTGGKYFRATDTDSLKQIYAAIDALEKTKVETHHFVDYRELAVQPTKLPAGALPPLDALPPLLGLALVLLLVRWLLEHTWLRELT